MFLSAAGVLTGGDRRLDDIWIRLLSALPVATDGRPFFDVCARCTEHGIIWCVCSLAGIRTVQRCRGGIGLGGILEIVFRSFAALCVALSADKFIS